jgi:hypothetical protein
MFEFFIAMAFVAMILGPALLAVFQRTRSRDSDA